MTEEPDLWIQRKISHMQKPVKMSAKRKEEADKADSNREIAQRETENKKKNIYVNITVQELINSGKKAKILSLKFYNQNTTINISDSAQRKFSLQA